MYLAPMERATVLVVDDHEDFLVSAQMLLERDLPEVDVLTEPEPERALEILERRRVDVVVVDYRMPRMDGLTFMSRAAELAPEARRVLITAYPDLGVLVRAINEAAIWHYIRKPTGADHLVHVVRDALAASGTGRPETGENGAAESAVKRDAQAEPGP